MKQPHKVREYALHVRPDGVEVLYRRLPEIIHHSGGGFFEGIRSRERGGIVRAHNVVVLKLGNGRLVEQTTIQSIRVNRGQAYICPQPRGEGWKVHDDHSDNYTVYRRPLPKGERAMFDNPDSE
jgi:hypothetical protein